MFQGGGPRGQGRAAPRCDVAKGGRAGAPTCLGWARGAAGDPRSWAGIPPNTTPAGASGKPSPPGALRASAEEVSLPGRAGRFEQQHGSGVTGSEPERRASPRVPVITRNPTVRGGRGHKFPLSGRGGNVTTAKPLWTDVNGVGTGQQPPEWGRGLRVGRRRPRRCWGTSLALPVPL